ncbi:GntR family transcriptional regulator [Roseibium sp. ROS1]
MQEGLGRTSKTNIAYVQIKQIAICGSFSPSQHLQPHELGDRLKLSATPVREALAHLAYENIVSFVPSRGYFGRRYDILELEELHHLADTIFAACFREYGANIPKSLDPAVTFDVDVPTSLAHFYRSIATCSENSQIIGIVSNYVDRTFFPLMNLFLKYSGGGATVEACDESVKLLERGQFEAALEAFTEHRSRLSQQLPELVRESCRRAGSEEIKFMVERFRIDCPSILVSTGDAKETPPLRRQYVA